MTGGTSLIFTRKAVASKMFNCNPTTCVNQSLGLMPVNYIPNNCVRLCTLAYIRDGITMKKHKNSRQSKIK